jgi:ABC-type polysaccharide/polyol phosphate export permease
MHNNIKTLHNYLSNTLFLAWIEIKLKYSRSVLGPFWITLSCCILVLGLTFINISLFSTDLKVILPWITTGIIFWNYITSIIEDSTKIFDNQKLLNIPIKLIDLVSVNVFKNIIILFHNLIVVLLVFLFLGIKLNLNFFFIFFGIGIFVINSYCISILFGLLCLRFRDFILIIKNAVYLIFLITPIFWLPSSLSKNTLILVDYNIIFQIIQSIRDPLLGNKLTYSCLLINIFFSILLLLLAFFFYNKFKKKALFWI